MADACSKCALAALSSHGICGLTACPNGVTYAGTDQWGHSSECRGGGYTSTGPGGHSSHAAANIPDDATAPAMTAANTGVAAGASLHPQGSLADSEASHWSDVCNLNPNPFTDWE